MMLNWIKIEMKKLFYDFFHIVNDVDWIKTEIEKLFYNLFYIADVKL